MKKTKKRETRKRFRDSDLGKQLADAWKHLRWQNMLCLLIAGCINAIGVTMFLAPVNLYDSGISGTSMLLWQVTPPQMSLSLFLILLNLPLFLFGMKRQGLLFTIYSVWAVLVYSVGSYVISYVLPVDVTASSPFTGQDLTLSAVFGGLISGVGSGLTIRFGGAIDGIEVLAVIFAKGLGMTVGTFVMVYNVFLYVLIGCIFHSWILPLYSIITYCIAVKSVDFIVEGLDKAKSVMIITTKEDAVCQALSEEFGRGITQISARGFYSGEEKGMVYFVVNRFQIAKLKSVVGQVDPMAFITISEVSDVMGSSLKQN